MIASYGLRIVAGLVLSLAIGLVAYRRRSLTRSGVLGAVLTGTLIFGLGGWDWGLLLIAFFVSSSLLTHYKRAAKAGVAEEFAKGGPRDLWQALANGGLAAAAAVGSACFPHPLWLFAFVGALAEANADTWATELGVLSKDVPRTITTGQPAAPGSSGAITWDGSGAALLGAGLIAGLAALFRWSAGEAVNLGWAIASVGTLAGFAGALADSLLGATLQGIYYCDTCGKETERRLHRCGSVARRLRGWSWLNNDWVNFIGTLVSALAAAGLGSLYLA
ncbi:MAG: DUF92 domain-containing protein [Thermoflexales bacterium]|nr:DUF92 domain-containing protein [Thermoflexales bacterium]